VAQNPSQPPKTQVNYSGPKAKQLAQDCIAAVRTDAARLDRDKADWLNILGFHGGVDNWWVTWDQVDNLWRRIPDDDSEYGLPAEVPRQASNLFKRKIDGIAAILNQSEPAQEWRPATDDDAARATADIIDDVLPVLRDECGYDQGDRELINLHVTLTDKVGYEVYFDTDEKYGTELIQGLSCPSCDWQGMPMEVDDAGGPAMDDQDTHGACPQCGAPGESLEPLLNPLTGEPRGVHYPKGKICGRVIPSFEISLPPSARECRVKKVPYLVTHTWMAREDAIRMYPKKAAVIRQARAESSAGNTSSQYASAVRNISSPHAAARGVMPQTKDAIVVWRIVHDPINDELEGYNFPDGLDIVLIDNEVIDSGPLPLVDDQGQPIKPIALRQYVAAPGSPFGIPPADDLGVLQRQRNLLETLLILILINLGSPTTWVPSTVTIEDEIDRNPGAINRYRSHGMSGEKPFTEPGVNPPEGLYKALEMNTQMFDTISGLNAILEGQHQEGVNTLGEVQRLQERGMATFLTPLTHLIQFENELAYLLLQTARQSLWTTRLIRAVGENGQWEIKQFSGADLHGSVDVYVNPTSAWPKSDLLQHLRLKDAIEMQVVDPHDPEIQEKVLSDYALTHLKPSLDEDRKQIARELERWKQAQSPQEIEPPGPFINEQFHVVRKSNFMKTEEAEAIKLRSPEVWQAMAQHISQLQQSIAAKQQAADGKAGGKGQDEPKAAFSFKGEDLADPIVRQAFIALMAKDGLLDPHSAAAEAPAPVKDTGKDTGPDGTVLDHHIHAGHLIPAGGPKSSPLDAHLAAGHLRPAPPAPPPQPGPPA